MPLATYQLWLSQPYQFGSWGLILLLCKLVGLIITSADGCMQILHSTPISVIAILNYHACINSVYTPLLHACIGN